MVIGMVSPWRILSVRGSRFIATLVALIIVVIVMVIVVVWTGPIRHWMLERWLDRRWSLSKVCRRLAVKTHAYRRAHKDGLVVFVRGSMLWRARPVGIMRTIGIILRTWIVAIWSVMWRIIITRINDAAIRDIWRLMRVGVYYNGRVWWRRVVTVSVVLGWSVLRLLHWRILGQRIAASSAAICARRVSAVLLPVVVSTVPRGIAAVTPCAPLIMSSISTASWASMVLTTTTRSGTTITAISTAAIAGVLRICRLRVRGIGWRRSLRRWRRRGREDEVLTTHDVNVTGSGVCTMLDAPSDYDGGGLVESSIENGYLLGFFAASSRKMVRNRKDRCSLHQACLGCKADTRGTGFSFRRQTLFVRHLLLNPTR